MRNNHFIGFFDSGVGGTTVWQEVHRLLPNESTVYLADSKNAPYGIKSQQEIIELSVKNTEFLIRNYPVKMIVVACNTATTNAIAYLRANYNIPFIGVEPAVKPAALQSKSGVIGVLATQGTLDSQSFHQVVKTYKNTTIIEQEGNGLVSLIESGQIHSPEMTGLLQSYLTPMIAQNIDYLVLGCTHYPLLKNQIEKIVPQHVQIIDSGEAIAKRIKTVLEENKMMNTTSVHQQLFYTNKDASLLRNLLPEQAKNVSFLDF